MQERGLTLNKCLDICRAAESASKQAKEIGDVATKTEVNAVKKFVYHAKGPAGPKPPPKGAKKAAAEKQQYRFCGFSHVMARGSVLPLARNATSAKD